MGEKLKAIDETTERGGVLILTAFLITTLAAILALVIDGSRLFTTHSEKLYSADYIALAALQAYYSASTDLSSNSHTARLAAANARAATIAEANFSTNEGGRTQGSSSGFTNESAGKITAGRWWTQRPASCVISGCPCTLPTTPTDDNISTLRGCFQECGQSGCVDATSSSAARFLANSIAVTLQVRSGSSSNIFARAAWGNGSSETTVRSSARAVSVPKRGFFLFDLSRGMSADTHPQWEKVGTTHSPATEASYEITSGQNCGGSTANPCPDGNSCSFSSTQANQVYANASTASIRSRYQCREVRDSGITKVRLYDVGTSTPVEPLNTLLVALRGAIDEFSVSGGVNDGFGVIGYDHRILPERIYPLLSNNGPGYEAQRSLLRSFTDLPTAAANNFYPSPGAGSDLAKAVSEALSRLKQDRYFSSSSSFIVAFTNGLLTCTKNGTCNQTFSQHNSALIEFVNGDIPFTLRSQETSFSAFYYSKQAVPRLSLLRSPSPSPGQCMTPTEMKTRNYLEMFSNDTGVQNETKYNLIGTTTTNVNYNLAPMSLASVVRFLDGAWTPIMPACNTLEAHSCNGHDTLCSSGPVPPATLTNASQTSSWTVRMPSPFLDAEGRTICDPNCLGISGQVSAQLRTLLTKNTLALVE